MLELSDRLMEWSLSGLAVLVMVWIVCSAVFLGLWWLWAILTGLAIQIVVGGLIVRAWGKSYMARAEGT